MHNVMFQPACPLYAVSGDGGRQRRGNSGIFQKQSRPSSLAGICGRFSGSVAPIYARSLPR